MKKKYDEIDILLKKMNRLFLTLQPGVKNKIDLDLLKDYTKQFYELLLEYESGKDVSVVIEEKRPEHFTMREISSEKTEENLTKQKLEESAQPVIQHTQKNDTPEIKFVNGSEEEEKIVMPKVEKKPELQKTAEVQNKKLLAKPEDDGDEEEVEKSAIGHKLSNGKKSLAEKINATAPVDLRRAIDLNDKFYFIRELFSGDHNAFDTAIKFMNSMQGMDDVKRYVQVELSVKYDWKHGSESVERFYSVLKEKFNS